MEASLRAPFTIRWPGKIPAGRVSNEIVHMVDLFTTLAHVGGAEIPKDRPIDGVLLEQLLGTGKALFCHQSGHGNPYPLFARAFVGGCGAGHRHTPPALWAHNPRPCRDAGLAEAGEAAIGGVAQYSPDHRAFPTSRLTSRDAFSVQLPRDLPDGESLAYHIITIEDPVEFMHRHKRSIIHQRELHSDTPSFALALRAALRQAPKVILVGEMRDKETIEIALEAAETGHLVLSTLHTIDASKTVERIVGVFPLTEQQIIRNRVAKSFRYVVSQRLIPLKDGSGRVPVFEVLKSTLRTREYLEKGEQEGKTLLDAMRDGDTEGMQHFDGSIETLIRTGTIDLETGLAYATNPGNLRLELADLAQGAPSLAARTTSANKISREPELLIER